MSHFFIDYQSVKCKCPNFFKKKKKFIFLLSNFLIYLLGHITAGHVPPAKYRTQPIVVSDLQMNTAQLCVISCRLAQWDNQNHLLTGQYLSQ
jgi:hypothetical protein